MPQFEIQGPDPDGEWFVVRIETITGVTSELVLDQAYDTAEEAQAAADGFNADPTSAPEF